MTFFVMTIVFIFDGVCFYIHSLSALHSLFTIWRSSINIIVIIVIIIIIIIVLSLL